MEDYKRIINLRMALSFIQWKERMNFLKRVGSNFLLVTCECLFEVVWSVRSEERMMRMIDFCKPTLFEYFVGGAAKIFRQIFWSSPEGSLLCALVIITDYKVLNLNPYLDSNGEIVLFVCFIVQGMIDLDVGPSEPIVLPLLEIERVIFIGLGSGSTNKTIENCWIPFNPGTVQKKKRLTQHGTQ